MLIFSIDCRGAWGFALPPMVRRAHALAVGFSAENGPRYLDAGVAAMAVYDQYALWGFTERYDSATIVGVATAINTDCFVRSDRMDVFMHNLRAVDRTLRSWRCTIDGHKGRYDHSSLTIGEDELDRVARLADMWVRDGYRPEEEPNHERIAAFKAVDPGFELGRRLGVDPRTLLLTSAVAARAFSLKRTQAGHA